MSKLSRLLCLMVAGLMLVAIVPRSAFALDDAQRKTFEKGIPYYNVRDCAVESNNEGVSGGAGGASSENAKRAFDFFVGIGFTLEQAAGIVGNLQQESGVDPRSEQLGGGPGRGIAQWTLGDRWAALQRWAAGRDIYDLQTQLDFIVHEMLNVAPWNQTIPAVRATNTPGDAAYAFQRVYERAGQPENAKRTKFANDALAMYGPGAPPVGSLGDIVSTFNPGAGGPGGPGAPGATEDSQQCEKDAGITGGNFPLALTKSQVDQQNPGLFANGTTGQGGHPYIAYDILAQPGTPVIAFAPGTVVYVDQDRCPGRMINIFDEAQGLTFSYLHLDMNNHVGEGEKVQPGQQIGLVGPASAGCGTAHLHIDAIRGNSRPGCSRNGCPESVRSRFVDIGPQLFEAYMKLPP